MLLFCVCNIHHNLTHQSSCGFRSFCSFSPLTHPSSCGFCSFCSCSIPASSVLSSPSICALARLRSLSAHCALAMPGACLPQTWGWAGLEPMYSILQAASSTALQFVCSFFLQPLSAASSSPTTSSIFLFTVPAPQPGAPLFLPLPSRQSLWLLLLLSPAAPRNGGRTHTRL
jgi:hypothetical protein